MAESFVEQVIETEQRYVGPTVILSVAEVVDDQEPFLFNIDIATQIPLPETELIVLDVQSVAGSDPSGITYGGQFRIKRNPLNGSPSIQVVGDGLTSDQKTAVLDALSITEETSSTGFGSKTTLQMSLAPIIFAATPFFDLVIPYEESEVHTNGASFQIPFLNFDATNQHASSFPNPVFVTVQQSQSVHKMIIDAGLVFRDTDLLKISNNTAPSRNITNLLVGKSSSPNAINVSWEEDVAGSDAITISPLGIPTLSSHPDGANLNVTINAGLYRKSGASSSTRSLYFDLDYNISKMVSGVAQPIDLFTVTFLANLLRLDFVSSTSLFFTYTSTTGTGSDSIRKKALNLTNNSSLELSVQILNHQDLAIHVNQIVIQSSNKIFLGEAVEQINQQLQSASISLSIGVEDLFEFAKISDMETEFGYNNSSEVQIDPSDTVFLYVRPLPHISSFSLNFTVFTIEQLREWFIDKFGSRGFKFDWGNTPHDPILNFDWLSLSVCPVLFEADNNILTNYGRTIIPFNATPSTGSMTFKATSNMISLKKCHSIAELSVTTTPSMTVEQFASALQDGFASAYYTAHNDFGFALSPLSIQIEAVDYFKNFSAQTYLGYVDNVTGDTCVTNASYSTGNSIAGTSAILAFKSDSSVNSNSFQLLLSSSQTITDLALTINNINLSYNDIIKAEILDTTIASSTSQSVIYPISPAVDITDRTSSIAMRGPTSYVFRKEYDLSLFSTLSFLSQAINSDLQVANIVVSVDAGTSLYVDANPLSLINAQQVNITTGSQPHAFLGQVSVLSTLVPPSTDVTLRFSIPFASGGPGGLDNLFGIQVAFGGYEKDGTFFATQAPNAFLEPVQNALSSLTFRTTDADVAYLLVRTRASPGSINSYSSSPSHYSGLVRYGNGSLPYTVNPFVPSDSKFTSVWDQGGSIDVPTVIVVPISSTTMDVTIEDKFVLESINVQVIDSPSVLDQFGFLAINRTNNTKSQTESKIAQSFGLVLDNRGVWDIIISPEASLKLNSGGSISYLGNLYSRTIFDDDEEYDFTIATSLPASIQNAVSIVPLPGNPQVWVLKLEFAVKKYLGELVSQNKDNCSLTLDLSVRVRSTGIEGTVKVVVYYDYKCVFDVGLCDFFWNLTSPPIKTVAGPEIIQNNLNFSYQTLVDCNSLSSDINNNISLNTPILISVSNIPTFKNGNALLLVKSSYTSEIQGFYFPKGNEIDSMQLQNCSDLNLNIPLMMRLNKDFLLLPNNENPITDLFEINTLQFTLDSYLLVRPQFYTPPSDLYRDCGPNEVVVVGIGYTFKNWKNGLRQDDILVGLNLVLPQNVYSSPSLRLCYKYYYNQKKT